MSCTMKEPAKRPHSRLALTTVLVMMLVVASMVGIAQARRASAATAPPTLSLPVGAGQSPFVIGTHSDNGIGGPKNAIDVLNADGHVRAAAAGTVRIVGCSGGPFVMIDHANNWHTGYYHLTGIRVSNGQQVQAGDLLGNMGTVTPCGGWASGNHVHFTLWSYPGVTTHYPSPGTAYPLAGINIGGWIMADGSAQCDHVSPCGTASNAATGRVVQLPSNLYNYGGAAPPPAPVVRDTALRSDGHSGYTLDGFGDVVAFSGAPAIPTSQESLWPGWNIARRLLLLTDNSGYVLDGFGGIHPFWAGGAMQPPAITGGAYWPNWDIARDIELLPDHTGGYQLDGYGGFHPFAIGANPIPPAVSGAPYWANWDIARAIAVNPAGTGGYVLDGFGGVHPFGIGSNQVPPAIGNAAYWPNWDIARDLVISFTGTSGYTLDGFGGAHPFAAGSPAPPQVPTARYTPGSDLATGLAISTQQGEVSGVVAFSDHAVPSSFGPGVRARKVVMLPGSTTAGYSLAGDGTITPFGGAPAATGNAIWPNWDIARDMALLPNATGGFVLDGYGGIHPFSIGPNPPPAAPAGAPYWPNWDIARSIVLTPNGTGGYLLDGFGGIHPFSIGSNPAPKSLDSTGAYWGGDDVTPSMALAGRGAVVLDSYGGVHTVH
ncbi:MAG: LasA protease [Acidimicrobiaceae bacterium]|nr:LasA protease [Acidimicrobiaceae bacterium]